MRTLHDLLLDGLRDLYSAEQQLLTALPEMAKYAHAEPLRLALTEHIATTNTHISRLCETFEAFGEAPEGKVCLPMEGLVTESQKLAQEALPDDLLDAALIASAHKITHYEMAAYGSLCGFAEADGYAETARVMRLSLADEQAFDARLTELAKAEVNPRARRPVA